MWHKEPSLERINERLKNTLGESLGMQAVAFDEESLTVTMPVDHRTHQPMGLLHGGASIALAETVGSIAANLVVDDKHFCVGMEINGNHVKAVRSGHVIAIAKAFHIGKTSHVWDIRITTEKAQLVCVSRLTMAVRKR